MGWGSNHANFIGCFRTSAVHGFGAGGKGGRLQPMALSNEGLPVRVKAAPQQ
jgi:hypothetical protein